MGMQLYLNIIMVEKYYINEYIFKKKLKCWPVRFKLSPDLHNFATNNFTFLILLDINYKYVTNQLQNYLNYSNQT